MSRSPVHLEMLRFDRVERTIAVGRTPFSIGADLTSDLPLREPGIAPRHAQIVMLGGAYYLLPDPSCLTLSLDGIPTPPDGVPLVHGATIGLGPDSRIRLRFLIDGATTRERGDRLLTLMEVARTITSSLAVDEVLARVLDGAVRFSGAERGYLFLKDGDRLAPWTRGQADAPSVEVSLSVAEEVARTGRPIYRDHLGGDEGKPVSDSIVRLRLQAILCLPLAVRNDVIGVVYLDSRKPLPHHGPDLPWLEALAGLAAIAIQNSRLVEERLRAERTLALGQMARAIVHDLRSPLTSIRGLADLLHGRTSDQDPSRHHLATIMSEADRLAALTGDLLHFAKESPPLERSIVKPADLIRRTLAPLAPRLEKAGVSIDLELDERASVSLDAQRMLRVLHNLVANALEAMPKGGSLRFRAWRDSEACLISLRDTGAGMTEEVRRRIFEPFFSHGKSNGNGLGMAIVRKIMDEHGGNVEVQSAPGVGTTVVLTLPTSLDKPPKDR